MSASEVHAAVQRSATAGLLDLKSRRPLKAPLLEFLIHGVRYAFPAKRGSLTRGIPTSWAAPVMAQYFEQSSDIPPVWPSVEGTVKGYALEPLYSSVPKASQKDAQLYQLLSLVDAMRDGRARERKIAENELQNSRLMCR